MARMLNSLFNIPNSIIPDMWVAKVPLKPACPMVIGYLLHVLHYCKPI